jgi:hypothetical protein
MFSDMRICILTKYVTSILFDHEDIASTFLPNVSEILPDFTAARIWSAILVSLVLGINKCADKCHEEEETGLKH